MSALYLLLGIAILAAGIIDFVWTTLWPDGGAGPITKRLAKAIWKSVRKLSGGGRHKMISIAGPLILVFTLLSWIVAMWVGWILIFASDPNSFSDTQDFKPINWWERIYYTGYLLFTLGNGDYSPTEGIWQFLTVIATASGLIFITLGVTYLLSVLGSVTMKHSLAESIMGLGDTPLKMVKNSWNGKDFHNLDLLLNAFTSQLSAITAEHNAYPILHFYNADQKKESLPVAVAVLDETLTVLLFGVKKEFWPNELLMKETRFSIQSYLKTLRTVYVSPADSPPPPPDLDSLRASGLPVVSNEEFRAQLDSIADRRKDLLGIVNDNERKWPSEKENG